MLWKKAKEANYMGENVANLPFFFFFTFSFKKYTYQSHLMDFLFYKDWKFNYLKTLAMHVCICLVMCSWALGGSQNSQSCLHLSPRATWKRDADWIRTPGSLSGRDAAQESSLRFVQGKLCHTLNSYCVCSFGRVYPGACEHTPWYVDGGQRTT